MLWSYSMLCQRTHVKQYFPSIFLHIMYSCIKYVGHFYMIKTYEPMVWVCVCVYVYVCMCMSSWSLSIRLFQWHMNNHLRSYYSILVFYRQFWTSNCNFSKMLLFSMLMWTYLLNICQYQEEYKNIFMKHLLIFFTYPLKWWMMLLNNTHFFKLINCA